MHFLILVSIEYWMNNWRGVVWRSCEREKCYSGTDRFISFKLILVCNNWAAVLHVLRASLFAGNRSYAYSGFTNHAKLRVNCEVSSPFPLPNMISQHGLFSSRKPTQEC